MKVNETRFEKFRFFAGSGTSKFETMSISAAATRPPLGTVDFKGEIELYLHWSPADANREPELAIRIGERLIPLAIAGGFIQGSSRATETEWAVIPINLLKEVTSSQNAEIQVDGERLPLRTEVRKMLKTFLEILNGDVK